MDTRQLTIDSISELNQKAYQEYFKIRSMQANGLTFDAAHLIYNQMSRVLVQMDKMGRLLADLETADRY